MSYFNGEINLRAGNVFNDVIEVTTVNEAVNGVGVTTAGVTNRGGYVQFADITAPANPANGQGRIYKKTGNAGLFWRPDAAGGEVDLATGVVSVGTTANNTITRWDGSNTNVIKGSGITVDNNNNMAGVANLTLESGTFDTTLAVTTQTVAAVTCTIPNLAGVSGDFVINNATQTMTNKTLSDPTISGLSTNTGSNFYVESGGKMRTRDITTNRIRIDEGGNNSSIALNGSSIMISDGTSVVQGAKGFGYEILHGNDQGAPFYGPLDLYNDDITGVLAINQGGTNQFLPPGPGQILIGNFSTFTLGTITAGNNITVTNSHGGITIAATATGFSTTEYGVGTHIYNIPATAKYLNVRLQGGGGGGGGGSSNNTSANPGAGGGAAGTCRMLKIPVDGATTCEVIVGAGGAGGLSIGSGGENGIKGTGSSIEINSKYTYASAGGGGGRSTISSAGGGGGSGGAQDGGTAATNIAGAAGSATVPSSHTGFALPEAGNGGTNGTTNGATATGSNGTGTPLDVAYFAIGGAGGTGGNGNASGGNGGQSAGRFYPGVLGAGSGSANVRSGGGGGGSSYMAQGGAQGGHNSVMSGQPGSLGSGGGGAASPESGGQSGGNGGDGFCSVTPSAS